MRVLLTSSSYPVNAQDWRGRFIWDMAQALGKTQEVDLELWAPPGEMPPNARYVPSPADKQWLDGLSKSGGIAHLLRKRGIFSIGAVFGLIFRLRKAYQRSEADIFHINWLQNALPSGVSKKPALVTVLGSDFGMLQVPGMVTLIRRALRGRRVIIAPNAEWMIGELEQYFGDLAEIRPIPFGIANAWFEVSRTPEQVDPSLWLAVTRLTHEKLGPIFEWGEQSFGGRRTLHLFGPRQDANITIPDWVHFHGPTYPEALRSTWFPRAAGLITLSRHDEGRPQVILEAMASGLPVIASRLSAHQNIIEHGKTGYLVDSQSTLLDALDWLGNIENNRSMGTSAKNWVSDHLGTWDDCASRYLTAYQDLLGEHK